MPTIAQPLQTKRRIPLADMRVGSFCGSKRTGEASREANRTRYPSGSWTKNWDTLASVSPVWYHLFSGAMKSGQPKDDRRSTKGMIAGTVTWKFTPRPSGLSRVLRTQFRPAGRLTVGVEPTWPSSTRLQADPAPDSPAHRSQVFPDVAGTLGWIRAIMWG